MCNYNLLRFCIFPDVNYVMMYGTQKQKNSYDNVHNCFPPTTPYILAIFLEKALDTGHDIHEDFITSD